MDLALKSITLVEMSDLARMRSSLEVKKAIYGVPQTFQCGILTLWRYFNPLVEPVKPTELALLVTVYCEARLQSCLV
jgi:hypothetical protein